MRTGRLLQALIVIAIFASTGAHAGKVNTNATTYYPSDRLYAYTYAWQVSGYPPMPQEYFIWGDDMQFASQGSPPYLFNYAAVLDSPDHIVGGGYSWRVLRYSDWNNRVLGSTVINQGTSTAY
jgi:hypothetical protein